MEEDRTPVGRPGFKPGEGRQTSLVGSTPTLFRHAANRRQPPSAYSAAMPAAASSSAFSTLGGDIG